MSTFVKIRKNIVTVTLFIFSKQSGFFQNDQQERTGKLFLFALILTFIKKNTFALNK